MIGLAAGGVIATVLVAGLPLLVIASAADPADPACAESGLMDVAGSSSTTDLGSGKAGLGQHSLTTPPPSFRPDVRAQFPSKAW